MAAAVLCLLTTAGVLAGCSARKQYGVATHTDPVTGTCDRSRNVEVGAALDLSGPGATLNREYLTGIRTAIAQYDHTGGILKNHSCLELLYKDDRGSAPVGDRAVLDLADDEVVAFLVAPSDSTTIRYSGADLGLAGVPTTTASSLDDVRAPSGYPMTFPVAPSAASQADVMVAYSRKHHWSSVAVAATDDPAGRQGLADLRARAGRAGLHVTAGLVVDRAHPVSAVLARLRATTPAGLIVVGDSLAVGPILAARAALGWSVPTVAPAVAGDGAVVGELGGTGTAGVSAVVPSAVVTPAGGAPVDPSMVAFLAQLRARLPGSDITGSIVAYAEGYDSVAML
ncbi:MAG TPA: ABC transporter substrate-binding protein, partial [Acidimicrobiales bacterium]|nr:ABC transporter substrate-binding protein [Acidimicrobiales bacterium]